MRTVGNCVLLATPALRINPLNAELNPKCHFLVLLGAHHIFHVSRIRVKLLHCCSRPGQRSRYSDSLRVGRSRDRIPVGARFPAPVHTGPGGPPSLLYIGYRVFPGGKERQRRGVDHPPPSSADVKERIQLYVYSTSGPS